MDNPINTAWNNPVLNSVISGLSSNCVPRRWIPNRHISRNSKSVTHIGSYTNSNIGGNSTPGADIAMPSSDIAASAPTTDIAAPISPCWCWRAERRYLRTKLWVFESFMMFHNILRVLHDIFLEIQHVFCVFHSVSQCFTSVSWCFTMFSESCNVWHRCLHCLQSPLTLWLPITAGICDNAAKVIPCYTPSWRVE